MARLARIAIPGVPHHVTLCGNRRLPVFFSNDDRNQYLQLVAGAAKRSKTKCLAWCLMDQHVYLILTPSSAAGPRATLGEAHRRYTRMINFREGWRGHLLGGRFASYPMADAHLTEAVRYVENNALLSPSKGRSQQASSGDSTVRTGVAHRATMTCETRRLPSRRSSWTNTSTLSCT